MRRALAGHKISAGLGFYCSWHYCDTAVGLLLLGILMRHRHLFPCRFLFFKHKISFQCEKKNESIEIVNDSPMRSLPGSDAIFSFCCTCLEPYVLWRKNILQRNGDIESAGQKNAGTTGKSCSRTDVLSNFCTIVPIIFYFL